MIVEDDADLAAVLRERVRDAGYRPIWARDGREALSAILDERPAAVLVDVATSAINGINLWATLERSPVLSRIPRLIVARGGGLARLPEKIRRLAGPTVRAGAPLA